MSSTSTACSSKIIEIEMDPPPSLSVSVIASSGSGYRLIGISILADVFMILSSPGFYGIQCFNLCDISEKKKELVRHMQPSCTVCFCNHTFLTSKQIDLLKKNKGEQKLYDVNVRAIYPCRPVGAGHEHSLKKLLLREYV